MVFLRPGSGEVVINDRIIANEDLKNFWPAIAYVRQQTFLIHDTILKNITLSEDTYDQNKLQCAIEASGLSEFIQQSPDGLTQMITENGKNISGGQQQRIALARAFYKNADLILLDEPFNELDDLSVTSFLEYFRELSAKGKMIVMITHDKKNLLYCNKIISLDEE
ncbi:MAG: ATP-binding cassette domain-containing protein [Chitinophagaceae bacterium]